MNDLSIVGSGSTQTPIGRRLMLRPCRGKRSNVAGFSLIEAMVVVVIVLIVAAMAIPQLNQMLNAYSVSSTAHSLAGMLNEAKIRAGSEFTLGRLNCTDRTSTAPASCQVEICTTKGANPGTCTTWTQDHGAQPLPDFITFQTGNITAVPGDSGQTTPTETLQIYFNSRGVPIDVSGAPVPTTLSALYIRDTRSASDTQSYAVVVTLSGRTSIYSYQGGSWVQQS